MLVIHNESPNWRWYWPLYTVETYDKVHDEYTYYRDCTLFETWAFLRYFGKRGADIKGGV